MLKVLVDGCEPTKGSKYSACIDLRASEDVVISAGETKLVGLGVCIDFEEFWKRQCNINLFYKSKYQQDGCKESFLQSHQLNLYPRSSLRAKGLVANTGIIDLDYKDEIKIIIHNPIKKGFIFAILDKFSIANSLYGVAGAETQKHYIKKGDRIAQIQLVEHESYLFGVESDDERNGGFGSTGND